MARKKEATEAGSQFLPHLTALMATPTPVPVKGDLTRSLHLATQNVLKVHDRMDPGLRTLGQQWYPQAHQFADKIGKGDVTRAAGVIAALSPQKGWGDNMRHAENTFRTGRAVGNTGVQNTKAQRILEGEHPEEVLGALKERDFYHSIVNPHGDTPPIDRHAHDLAAGQFYGDSNRGLSTPSRYQHFQEAYRRAADHLGVPSNEVQAVTWTGWRGTAS